MKLLPFDIEKAKAGAKVAMRNGGKFRILCFDRKGGQPIIGLVEHGDEESEKMECYKSWTEKGTYLDEGSGTPFDLLIVSEPTLVPWTREDVPPVCWLEVAGGHFWELVTGVGEEGIFAGGTFRTWEYLKEYRRWSPDPRDPSLWKPCAKEVWE